MSNWKKYEDVKNVEFRENSDGGKTFRIRKMMETGKSYTKTFEAPTGLGKRDLHRWVLKERERILENLHSPTTRIESEMSLTMYFESVYLQKSKVKNLKPKTLYDYKRNFKQYIQPTLGNVRLCDLRRVDVERLFDRMDADGVGNAMIAYVHRVLRTILNYAVDDELISRNPAVGRTNPTYSAEEKTSLTVHELNVVLEHMKNETPYWNTLVVVMANTGCRRGEIAALRWEDIDFENGTISFVNNAVKIPGEPLSVGTPKTKSSSRRIPMVDDVAEALQRHHAMYPGMEFVFFSPVNPGNPIAPDTITNYIRKLSDELSGSLNGKHISPHSFRHTFTTIVREEGLATSFPQRILGHSSAAVTGIYDHSGVSMESKSKTVNTFNSALKEDRNSMKPF